MDLDDGQSSKQQFYILRKNNAYRMIPEFNKKVTYTLEIAAALKLRLKMQ